MKRVIRIVALMALTQAAANAAELQTLKQQFEHPPDAYKPMPLWFVNGELTTEGIRRQLTDAR